MIGAIRLSARQESIASMRVYGALVSLAVWIGLVPWELLRIALRRSSWEILRQRLGRAQPASGPDAPLLVHAVSAGEMVAAESLIAAWVERHPGACVTLTTGTADGLSRAADLSRRHPGVRQPSYLPWDRPATMRRWLAGLRPAAVAVVETEIWPGLFLAARASGIPLAVVSARLPPRDARRYRLARWFFANVLESCEWIGAQDEEAAALYRKIGAPADRLDVVGNLKAAGTPAPPPPARLAAALEEEGVLLVAGSTHAPEELGLLRMLVSLRRHDPRIRLVLAPRHPRRARRVATAARRAGLTPAPTSGVSPAQIWNVLVVDSMGLLASLYPFADLVFVGGSLARRGGHNPLEAAACGRPILVGPDTENFREITEGLETAGALRRARTFEQLEALVRRLLEDAGERAAMSRAAKTYLDSRRDVGAAYAEALTRLAVGAGTAPRFLGVPQARSAAL